MRALPLRDGAHASGATGPLLLLVTWTLTNVDGGTRLRLVHSGTVLPKNGTAFRNLTQGRKKVVGTIHAVSSERSQKGHPLSSFSKPGKAPEPNRRGERGPHQPKAT